MSNDLKLIANDLKSSQSIFLQEKTRLENLLQNFAVQVEHIGSTSVPHTIGKGIIDILLLCANEKDQEQIRDVLAVSGYRQGELNKNPDGRLFFYNSDGQTQAGDIHLHLVLKDSSNLQSISLRDYLLTHLDEVEHYNQEKIRLAQSTNNDRHEYVRQKETFIKYLMSKIS